MRLNHSICKVLGNTNGKKNLGTITKSYNYFVTKHLMVLCGKDILMSPNIALFMLKFIVVIK